jgi:ATP-dependent Clp protease ATP-binding subunit ClpB
VEKAHPDVWNVLLQLLDDGRLTDGHGRTVDFRNSVVIMTSNVGSHHFREVTDPEKVKTLVLEELRQHLRPELLNRIDEVIVFASLGRDEITRIVDIQLEYLKKRLAAKRIGLELTDAAKQLLAREGFDPVYGARPLKRTIQRRVQDPLALKILEGEFAEGDTVKADARGDDLVFTRVAEAVPVE